MSQASFTLQGHNPDVLTCIANLSNDEVFTPPEFANQMLDTLAQSWASSNGGENIWSNKEVTFLDPCTKSGVFLREIVKRLNDGLTKEITDLTERINHILTKQVFGIGITELTSLLARRSVYCSKFANGIHSIARTFTNDNGNIWFERTEHEWANGKCKYCGASKGEYSRAEDLETHAYAFIHTQNLKSQISEMFGAEMQFDVIIGNPPYQMSDGGGSGTSAAPIYQHFVTQAKKLEPRFLTMVVPSRWFSGGKGLDDFRHEMLTDNRIRQIEDFPDSSDVFPGVQIKGGICYFLWNRDNRGDVTIATHDKGSVISESTRPLLEPGSDVFIRYNEAIPVLRKMVSVETNNVSASLLLPDGKRFGDLVSVRRPFNLESTFKGKQTRKEGDVEIYRVGGTDFAPRSQVDDSLNLIDKWKVFIPFLASGSDSFPHPILGTPFIGRPGTASTETYLAIGPFRSKKECSNVISYISTRFFRFVVLQKKPSQNATRKVYDFVPVQDFTEPWSDEKLYKKYGITKDEIAFIESMIRPMELDGE
jgi:site-specific DNA-methyltransferase (adenine-specific)